MQAQNLDRDPRNYTVRDFKKSRLVVQDTISYVAPHGDTTQDHINFTHWVEQTNEQPYVRQLEATPEWTLVPIGWAGEWQACSMLWIENQREVRQTRPTPEEVALAEAKVLEVHFGPVSPGDEATFFIPPGESLRGRPKKFNTIYTRCLGGSTRYTLSIYPG
jgi:hypothetical protein